ncbi:MAG: fatty acid-binding protein DegV [Dehalococcoidia bacterium]|nr:fatty acid-binding protein DegV [Dehalococcoidia bacterium]|tara:strand:- start:22404 stop:23243 length:840 start_codon:yes stop_codon:yes gene_type:complete
MTISIITDSASDIPKDLSEALGVRIVPCHVLIDGNDYRDGIDISTETFYDRLQNSPTFPTTSQPSIAEFQALYQEELNKGHDIISIHVSSKLSGTVNSALQAKLALGNPPNIIIIDSKLASFALGLVTMRAIELSKQQQDLGAIQNSIVDLCNKTHCIVALDTLDNLYRGGRIGKAQAFLGGMLSVKPILHLKDGEVHPLERSRSLARATNRLSQMFEEYLPVTDVGIIHSTNADNSVNLLKLLSTTDSPIKPIISQFGPTLGTHVGPNAVGICFITSS